MNRQAQILSVHAAFIHEVVRCIHDSARDADFEQLMMSAADNGWNDLVNSIRQIRAGRRDMELLNPLDEEDRVITEAILKGLQDPATLPDPNAKPDPAMAAPGLASMIHAAASGNSQALQIIANMAEQMSKVGGPMARLASVIRPLINGERDPDKLCKKLDSRTEQMVLGILRELEQLEQD
ncbi:MAG: hypothetical protein QNJ78_06790 [Gammaproteobacteria bacterium]|nr:hypothetical protein [Gammaproteobacteria bacterium]